MSTNFEHLVLGDGGTGHMEKAPFALDHPTAGRKDMKVEIPTFLQDDYDRPPPNFRPNSATGNDILPWMEHAEQASERHAEEEKKAGKKNQTNQFAKSPQPGALASSSAESLNFSTASGLKWNLQRENILGKGSYGCATLYRQKGKLESKEPGPIFSSSLHTSQLTSSSSSSASCGPLLVVVKDINFQTMCNREEDMESLRNEVNILRSSIGHPNCLQFLDYHEANRMAYIITEYCGGRDLAFNLENLQQGGPGLPPFAHAMKGGGGSTYFTESFIASILLQLCMALYFLHAEQRVLHRDVKPQNLFLLADGRTLRIGDFGTAARLGAIGGKLSEACGSPFYMAPELLQERAYDAGVDVWSAGVVLYELMALERPFQASTLQRLLPRILEARCPRLEAREELVGVYSSELCGLVQSMLTVQPTARPTFRRILRSSYARRHLVDIPRNVLVQGRRYYGAVFGEDAVEEAIKATTEETHQNEDALGAEEEEEEEERWNAQYEDDEFEVDDG